MTRIAQHKEKILGLITSCIFLLLILWNLDLQKLIATFKIFNYKVLYVFVPLYILSLWIRGFRWKNLLCDQSDLSTKEAFFAFTTGNTINSYLPARAGDFWRAYHIGKKLNESKMKMLGSIILERIIDGISVLLILFFAVLTYFKKPWALNIAYVSALLFLGSLTVFYIILKFNKIDYVCTKITSFPFLCKFKKAFEKMAQILNNFMDGFAALNNPKCFTSAFSASCLAWAIECLLTYILICGFGTVYGFSIAFFVISFIALSTIIPSSSIFVGPYQFAYILALSIYNIDKSNALAIAFIHQISIMLITTIISIIYFLSIKNNFTTIKQEMKDTTDARNT